MWHMQFLCRFQAFPIHGTAYESLLGGLFTDALHPGIRRQGLALFVSMEARSTLFLQVPVNSTNTVSSAGRLTYMPARSGNLSGIVRPSSFISRPSRHWLL
jgi:hypothetical protein